MRMLIVAGDPSGDLYGSLLIRALKAREPSLRLQAVGGSLMRGAAVEASGEFLHDLASMGLTGFVEPLRGLLPLLRLRSRLSDLLHRERPDALVCIDFYGFNRRVLEAAKSAGVKAFYFISPQVWASRPARVAVLRRLVDRMIVIFPFEEKLYREAGVPVSWVGHPLLDILPEPAENPPEGPLRLGLLPGSRPSEISRHLGVLLSAAGLVLRERRDSVVSVFASPHLPDIVYDDALRGFRSEGRGVRLVRDSGYQERRLQSMALTSSGTATVENALLGIPMVVIYRLSWPTYALARALIRVPHIAMANLLAGRALVPELIQGDATPQRIAQAALGILSDPPRLAALRRDLLSLRGTLGGPGAVGRAADILLREARR